MCLKAEMATVFKARDPDLNRLVALKQLSGKLEADPAGYAAFKRECQILGQLDHPSIVRVWGAEKIDDRHYLVMQFCRGQEP